MKTVKLEVGTTIEYPKPKKRKKRKKKKGYLKNRQCPTYILCVSKAFKNRK